VRWKDLTELPRAAEQLESLYDLDARYRTKRDTHWLGYMVHYTETCDFRKISLIPHVHTTPATVHEAQCTALIQEALSGRRLTTREYIVDAAYVGAELLVTSEKDHHTTLVGPPRPQAGWQNKVAGA
jgi:transposase